MNIVGQCIRGYDQALRVGRIRFASCEIGNKLTEEERWAKLRLVKEVAGTLIVSDHNSYEKTDRGMQCVPVFLKLETDCFIFPDKL